LHATSLENTVSGLEAKLAAALASLEAKEDENLKLRSQDTRGQETLLRLSEELRIATDSVADWQERARQAAATNIQVVQDLKEQQRQTSHWNQQADAVQSTTISLTQSVSDLKKENRELQQAVRLANKLQTLSEADVAELRGRYEIALRAQEHQHGLLLELESKLRVAARYFQRLQNAPALLDKRLIVSPPPPAQQRKNERRSKSAKKDEET
jgi:chromosome segregation ATPase